MKMRMVWMVAAILVFCSSAFAQSVGEKTGVNSVLGLSPSTQDFVRQVAIGDMFEIQSSELAQQKADATTKVFAEQMIAAHQKTSNELKQLIASGKLQETLPAKLDDAHQAKIDALRGLQGADFIKQYTADQVDAHKDAVSLFERYAAGGDNPSLKSWAGKTLPTIQHHLMMAEALEK